MKKNILNVCIAGLLGLTSVTSQAAIINLTPVGSTAIKVGETVTFEIWADFADVGGTIGGGLDIFYNSAMLSYNNDFTFDAAFGNDPVISRTGDDCSLSLVLGCISNNEINSISPNSFSAMADGLSLMGTLSFTGRLGGLSDLILADNDLPAGGWFDNSNFSSVIPTYNGASVEVSNVPVPAAAWLLFSGLGLLGSFSRVRANTRMSMFRY